MRARTVFERWAGSGGVTIILFLAVALPPPASAQLIPIRTVPVAQSHQFDFFPSQTRGMGGVSIALADSLLDPFVNPALGTRLASPRFFGSPALYHVSGEAGGGWTAPIGALTKAGRWYGGVSLAFQQVDLSDDFVPAGGFPCPECSSVGDFDPADDSRHNRYVFASLGRDFSEVGLSIGGSVSWAGLNAVDGVDQLHMGSAGVEQAGRALDVRLAVLKEWAGDRSLQALVLHNRFNMAQDILHLDQFWDPDQRLQDLRPRVEENLDRSHTWGVHVEYEQPFAAEGWRLGWLATVNRTTHVSMPDYGTINVPQDPGRSVALNAGVGVARRRGTSTFGLDLIYEPIWTTTRRRAETAIERAEGETIPAGAEVRENRFRFSNAVLRMGVGDELDLRRLDTRLGLQLGLDLRSVRYTLEQRDDVEVSTRTQDERWAEWAPTWGLSVRRPAFELRYSGRVTHGTGRPGFAPTQGNVVFDQALGFYVVDEIEGWGWGTPQTSLNPVRLIAHQISVSLPLR